MNDGTILVTGGAGFVGSNVVRAALEHGRWSHAVVLDSVVDELASAAFTPYGDRVVVHLGDVTDPDCLRSLPRRDEITHVVHGAMIAHVSAWELEDPARYMHVNVGGTANVLAGARHLPALQRFLYVSSGAVYGEPTAASPPGTQPESGPLDPAETYGISKLASELVTRRLGTLFDLDVRIARLSWVFGPMERPTPGRTIMSPPHAIVRAILDRREFRVTRRSLDAVGDFLSSEDAASGIVALLAVENPGHVAYNIALGRLAPIAEVLEIVTEAHPAFSYRVVEDGETADLDHDPALRCARWNAYEIARIARDAGWTPRPLAEQLRTYLDWALALRGAPDTGAAAAA